MSDGTATATAAEIDCQVCGEPVQPQTALACARCSAPYHVDCWHFIGRCSIFGCEGKETSRGLVPAIRTTATHVRIDETTRDPVFYRPLVEGWLRKLRTRARHIPQTVLAGAGGAFLAYGAMAVFTQFFGHLYQRGALWRSASHIPVIGIAYGLAAPFLAPWQRREPGQVAAVSGLVAMGSLVLCRALPKIMDLGFLGGLEAPFLQGSFILFVLAAILFASSLAELAFGPKSRLGSRIAKGGSLLRVAATWAVTVLALLPAHKQLWVGGTGLSGAQILEVAIWGLLAAATGGTAMETGKTSWEKEMGLLPQGAPKRLPGA